jgi:hypothetical protein
MKEFKDYRSSREGFVRDMREGADAALETLIGAAMFSSDPKVTAACARWKTMDDLATFLEGKKETGDGR